MAAQRNTTVARGATARRPRRERSIRSHERAWEWISLGPTMLLVVLLMLVPVALLLLLSFLSTHWEGGSLHWSYEGLANFLSLPDDPFFLPGVRNTLVFVAATVLSELVLGFLLAVAVSRRRHGRAVFVTVIVLPFLIPAVVIGAMWKLLYNYDFGFLNTILALFGLAPQNWLGDADMALTAVVVVDIWHWTSYVFLLLFAGLESLPRDYFEAARLDGASFFQELRYVTLPLMAPVLLMTGLTRMLLAFKVFDEIFLLTEGGPGTATEVVSYTVYRTFFLHDQQGAGSAMSVTLIVAVVLIVVVVLRTAQRRVRQAR